ncbi:hypothetical protein [Pseudoduganella aquatica]|uniref:Uncharacterized protein n=1 Tax=Pseudoduganella aquatica TaxID=2660641 RepID=A0A7X4HFD4_9BURK|nr:hypothetical protein [Pseudoduganella aquatica]MYN10184.1 hypothetical protein [Pseudoduganella aquatica]
MDTKTFLVVKDASKGGVTERRVTKSGDSVYLVKESAYRSAMGAAKKVLDAKDPNFDARLTFVRAK